MHAIVSPIVRSHSSRTQRVEREWFHFVTPSDTLGKFLLPVLKKVSSVGLEVFDSEMGALLPGDTTNMSWNSKLRLPPATLGFSYL